MSEEKKLEQNQHEKPMSFITMVILTGLFGGIFWSSLAYFAYWISLTDIPQSVVLEPWALGDWKKGWLGVVMSILVIGLVSIGAALVYYAVLRRFKSIWVPIGYGVLLFALVFFVLNPIFPGIKPFNELSRNTIITSVCFYVLYGTFIGYSISYEDTEVKNRDNQQQEVTSNAR